MVRGSQPSSIEGSRLPSYLTLFLAHALRGVFYPAGFSYPHTARHLLQRPELDLTDVPMFLSMIFSSSDDWKRDRVWMLRLVRDGLKSNADWKIFRRRHIFEYLVAYLDASEASSPTRTTILEV
jgi:nucleolar pre-ribosomal-associated protein 1